MAFYGLTFIYKAFHRYFPGKKVWLGLILFFTPSIMFWSSGILKEGPLLFVFGITLNVLNKIFTKRAYWQHYILIVFCFLFLFHLKFYVGLLLIPATTGYLWILNPKGPHPIIKTIINFGLYFFGAVIFHKISWNWSLFTVLKWKRQDFLGLAKANEFEKNLKFYLDVHSKRNFKPSQSMEEGLVANNGEYNSKYTYKRLPSGRPLNAKLVGELRSKCRYIFQELY